MYAMSFKKKIYLLSTFLVLLTAITLLTLNLYDYWTISIKKEFEAVEGITVLLDKELGNTYDELLKKNQNLSTEEKKRLLNEKLQPFVDRIIAAYPNNGAGYYSKELQSIVAFGPDFTVDGLKDISQQSKARTVYETKQPYKFRDYSQTRDAHVLAIIHPIIRDGEVIGHTWANITLKDVFAEFTSLSKKRAIFIVAMVVAALAGTYFIINQFLRTLKMFKEHVQNIESDDDNKDLPLPELDEIYHEVIRSRKLLRKKEKEFQKMVKQKIIQAQDRERKRVSQDLHDSVGQSLYSILVSSKLLNEMIHEKNLKAHIQNIEKMVSAAMDEVKNISIQLRPSALDDLGLVPAIRSLIERFQKNYGFEVEMNVSKQVKKRYGPLVEMYLYRISQEALNNIAKYAETKKVYISICDYDNKLEMVIRDEGNGFNVEEMSKKRTGLGLVGMQERASLLNGEFTIQSEIGKGTTIQVIIPLDDSGELHEETSAIHI